MICTIYEVLATTQFNAQRNSLGSVMDTNPVSTERQPISSYPPGREGNCTLWEYVLRRKISFCKELCREITVENEDVLSAYLNCFSSDFFPCRLDLVWDHNWMTYTPREINESPDLHMQKFCCCGLSMRACKNDIWVIFGIFDPSPLSAPYAPRCWRFCCPPPRALQTSCVHRP